MKSLERWKRNRRRKKFVKKGRRSWKGFEKTRIAFRELRRSMRRTEKLIEAYKEKYGHET